MTKKIQSLADLSEFSIGAATLPPGRLKLWRFCKQVEAGETPDHELLTELAAAFRLMLAEPSRKKQPAVFMRAMQLNKRKGLKPPREAAEAPRFEAAVRVFLADPDGTDTNVIGSIAGDLGVDESAVRRWVKEHRESAQPFARWILSMERRRKG